MTNFEKINKLEKTIELLHKEPQILQREIELNKLKLELGALKNKSEALVNELSLFLINSYLNNGNMRVALHSAGIIEGTPVKTGNPIQDFWNVRDEAKNLASRKIYFD